jgi:hypothetical protein
LSFIWIIGPVSLLIAAFTQGIGDISCSTQQCLASRASASIYVELDAFGSPPFYELFIIALLILPICIGMFIGVPLVAREFEQGTYRCAWTQNTSWLRWLLFKIGGIALYIFCIVAILISIFHWWKVPVLAATTIPGIFQPAQWGYANYDAWSIPAIAYTIFALFLGICIGTILRKSIPAMAVTLVLFVVVRILIEVFWRPYFLPPMIMKTPQTLFYSPITLPASALMLQNYEVDSSGKKVSLIIFKNLNMTVTGDICDKAFDDSAHNENVYKQCVATHGLQRVIIYQPLDRLWIIEIIECSIYLLLSAMLLVLTIWWTKYRIIGEPK